MKSELIRKTENKSTVKNNNLRDFPENTVGIIMLWPNQEYVGNIVVLKGNKLHVIENLIKDTGNNWDDFASYFDRPNHMIGILPEGTEIKITL